MRDSETESYRKEQGKRTGPADPRDRVGTVPIAPSSAGVVGHGPEPEPSTVEADRQAAEAREAEGDAREDGGEGPRAP